MTVPLLATKLYVPPVRPRLVSRPRLVEVLRSAMHRRLTLICAPAGFGKTTLLSECVAACQRPVAWLALDQGDNDPSRFLAYLVGALRQVEEGIGEGVLGALQSPQAPQAVPLLVRLINELTAISFPYVVVLDDYHVIEAEPIHEVLTFLLEHQPPQMHLIIATRTDPALPIARLRGRGQVTELRQNDLRFTLDETAEFLNGAMGLELSAPDLATLASRTEGWVAGLQMAAVSMRGQQDPSAFVDAFAGSHRHVLDYLMEEVLKRQPDRIQAFLLQTAILDHMTAPLCDAVLGPKARQQAAADSESPVTSQEILDHLDRANLFVVPLDQERRWYRYHHLFADLLRQRLQQTRPGSVLALHQRAGRWCEQEGLVTEAIGHALAAEDYAWALALVEDVAETVVMRSELATLEGWLEALPDGLVRTRPMLCILHTWILLLRGGSLEAAEARLQDAVDADLQGAYAGEVLAVRALMATYQRRTGEALDLSHRALEQLPEDKLFFRSFINGFLGYNALYSGDLVTAREALEETVRLGLQAGNLVNTVLALCHLGDVSTFEGRLAEARAFYQRALAVAAGEQGRRQPIAGMALIGLGQLLTMQCQLDDAARHFEKGIELVQGWGRAGAIGGYIGLSRIRRYQGDLVGALEAIEEAEDAAVEFEAMTADDVYVAREKARLQLAQGEIETVFAWLEESGVGMDVEIYRCQEDGREEVPYNRIFLYFLAIRAHLAQDRPDKALQLLRPLLVQVEGAGWTLYEIRLWVLEALALYQQGELDRAMEPLERALALSMPEGFVGIYYEEGPAMVELLRHAASRGLMTEVASDLFARLTSFSSAQRQAEPIVPIQPLVDPLSDRELDVLRLLATSLSTAEIADELFISVSTVRSHTKSIYGKLNVHRRWDAAERARALKLI